ncbi:MAG: DUF222 domain-containing protein [Sporichthyaceae bacterium]
MKNEASAVGYAWVLEVSLRRPGSVSTVQRLQLPHERAVDEIRAALGISATAAGRLLNTAWDAIKRLPELHAAMAAGGLDEQRAAVFVDWTAEMSDEHAHAVVAELLPRAVLDADEQLPAHLLIKEIATIGIALDPTWAERRFKESVRRRRVVGRANPDGTADVSGQSLEPHRAAAVCGRLTELARAAKRDGDPRPIDHLRVELFCGMLDGTYEGMTDTEIFAALAASRPATQDAADPTDCAAAPVDPAARAAAPGDCAAPADCAGETSDPAALTADVGAADSAAASNATSDPAVFTADAGAADSVADSAAASNAADTARPADAPASAAASSPPRPVSMRRAESPQAGVHLRIRLTTLLGVDRAPAELAGWTPVNPDYALDLMATMAAAQWRYSLTDDEGHPIGSGLIRTRPRGWRKRTVRHRGIVDILVPATLLRDLVEAGEGIELVDPEQYRSWYPVLAELTDRMRHPKPLPDDSDRRMPGRGLRRAVELDQPRCIGVGCGRPARRCEIDHRRDWALGGRTVGVNLGPVCGRDHGLKTEGLWTLHSWTIRGYRWCTALGRHYVVSVPPVLRRLPAPGPDLWMVGQEEGPDPDRDHEDLPWQVSQVWQHTGPLPPPAATVVYASPPAYPDEPPF